MTDHLADAGKPMPAALRLAELFELFAIDHEPDGWPGVRQAELNEAAAELRRLHAEYEALRSAIRKLHAAKGRYHTQLAACDLFDLVGLPIDQRLHPKARHQLDEADGAQPQDQRSHAPRR